MGPWGTSSGSFGNSQDTLDVTVISCPEGYWGWKITYGSFIGRITYNCASSAQSFGKGLLLGSGSTDGLTLLANQSIVGFQVYSDSLGIHAMSIEYVEFPPTGRCYNAIGEPTGLCPAKGDYLAILWGFFSVVIAVAIVFSVVGYIRKRRHKQDFLGNDSILPLR